MSTGALRQCNTIHSASQRTSLLYSLVNFHQNIVYVECFVFSKLALHCRDRSAMNVDWVSSTRVINIHMWRIQCYPLQCGDFVSSSLPVTCQISILSKFIICCELHKRNLKNIQSHVILEYTDKLCTHIVKSCKSWSLVVILPIWRVRRRYVDSCLAALVKWLVFFSTVLTTHMSETTRNIYRLVVLLSSSQNYVNFKHVVTNSKYESSTIVTLWIDNEGILHLYISWSKAIVVICTNRKTNYSTKQ